MPERNGEQAGLRFPFLLARNGMFPPTPATDDPMLRDGPADRIVGPISRQHLGNAAREGLE